jgi:hypothetical protein
MPLDLEKASDKIAGSDFEVRLGPGCLGAS